MSKYESQGFETRPMNISGGQKSVKEWESLRTAITGNKLVLNDVFSTEAGREGLSCGTCPDERCCSFVSVSALPPPSRLKILSIRSLSSLSVPLALPHIPSFLHPYPPFPSLISQILLTHLPPVSRANSSPTAKIVSENTFSYLYISFAAFSAASSFK